MRIFKRQSHLPYLAHSVWKPNRTEKDALLARSHVAELGRVDQLWEWLKENHSDLTAVEAPHGLCPESFTYGQLADLISKAAATLSSFGIGKGDVVAFFAENGPRWLIVDQAIIIL